MNGNQTRNEGSEKPLSVLWISPNLNVYRARSVDALASRADAEVTVISGGKLTEIGHRYTDEEYSFRRVNVDAKKGRFAFRLAAFRTVTREIRQRRFDAVVMPVEKKLWLMIFYVVFLRFWYRFKLFSYNHRCLRSSGRKITRFNLWLTKFFFWFYDCIIFYNAGTKDWSVSKKLIKESKATFANNTLDVKAIREKIALTINRSEPPTLLFVGRMVGLKRPDLLKDYYLGLKKMIPALKLEVIGDGPEVQVIKDLAEADQDVTWHGAIVDEELIAPLMDRSHAVFIPGDTGLSIVHSFSYGKPYITLGLPEMTHGPEIDYLRHGENGLNLAGSFEENVAQIAELLSDSARYEQMCKRAIESTDDLGVENWGTQVYSAILQTVRRSKQ